jgi:hypothetical protein
VPPIGHDRSFGLPFRYTFPAGVALQLEARGPQRRVLASCIPFRGTRFLAWDFEPERLRQMNKGLGIALAGISILGMSGVAIAKPQTTHVRGTIEDVSGDTLAVKSYGGTTTDLKLNSDTKYLSVVPSSLSQVKKGHFIGTAATGPKDKLVAQEVVIFPDSMRGAGEGHYPWSMPATVARADTQGNTQSSAPGASPVHGTMTNGTVANAAQPGNGSPNAPPVQGTMTNGTVANTTQPGSAPPVKGTMTNGTVTRDAGATGGEELTISYNNGEKVQVSVPPGAPVVRFVPAQRSVMTTGAKTFVTASTSSGGNEPTAKVVAVGKDGLMPPM